jgi:hypothetical protein
MFIINVLSLDLFSTVQCYRLLTSSSLPAADLTPSCANALTADLPCNDYVRRFGAGQYHAIESLERACTSNCDIALSSYQNSIESGQNFSNDGLLTSASISPIVSIPEIMRYRYNKTCLMNKGRYCNVVAYEAAMAHHESSQESTGYAHKFHSTRPADLRAKMPSRPSPPLAKIQLQLISVAIALSRNSNSKPAYHFPVDQELSPFSAPWCPHAPRLATLFQLPPPSRVCESHFSLTA